MFRNIHRLLTPVLFVAAALGLRAQPILIPNASFEFPATPFVDNRVTDWRKFPKPVWYDESGGFTWDQLSGVFRNTDPGKEDHIENCDGNQGFYLFAVPGVGLSQEGFSAARFVPGKAYQLTAGILGGNGGMTNGVSLEMSLFYRDAAGNAVAVAATNILHDTARFPTRTRFVDIALRLPPVRPGDPWAGKDIGVRFVSTVDPAKAGGYWDIDQVRLAEVLEIPNASFESPSTAFVDNRVDRWQKTPKPVWYDESGGFTWDQLSGVFRNTDPGKEDHIENSDGSQGFYLFAVPTVGLFLDAGSTNSLGAGPVAPFEVRFEPGRSYGLTVGVLGGNGGMTNGATLDLSLYYRDEAGVPVTVARTTVTNTSALFPTRTRYVDFQVRTPSVMAGDAWVGRPLGVQFHSTVDPQLAGGYWDIDHVRLEAVPDPVLLNPRVVEGRLESTLQSAVGLRFEVVSVDSLSVEPGAWQVLGTVTNTAGFVEIRGRAAGAGREFLRVRSVP
jgi:hypothetical protein